MMGREIQPVVETTTVTAAYSEYKKTTTVKERDTRYTELNTECAKALGTACCFERQRNTGQKCVT